MFCTTGRFGQNGWSTETLTISQAVTALSTLLCLPLKLKVHLKAYICIFYTFSILYKFIPLYSIFYLLLVTLNYLFCVTSSFLSSSSSSSSSSFFFLLLLLSCICEICNLGGWFNRASYVTTTKDGVDPALALLIAHLCYTEYSVEEIKRDLRPNTPNKPPHIFTYMQPAEDCLFFDGEDKEPGTFKWR